MGDGRMKARLKILPNEPRGAAWPSSARGAISGTRKRFSIVSAMHKLSR